MTILCITGQPTDTLMPIAEHLYSAGLEKPRSLQREHPIDLPQWHKRVLANLTTQAQTRPGATPTPSRLWEQLAVDLILANIDSPAWGWADPRSAQLLDFWSQLEDSLHFVLICQSPLELIAHTIGNGATLQTDDTAKLLSQWHEQHQNLLRFHARHPHNSRLILSSDAHQNPQQLSATLRQHWGTPLDSQSVSAHRAEPFPPLLLHLAAQILSPHTSHIELQDELHASITRLTPEAPAPQVLSTVNLIDNYRQITDRTAENNAITTLQRQLHEQQQQTQTLQSRIDIETASKSNIEQQLSHTSAELEQANGRIKEGEAESELLLHQLHQVQEELEKHYLLHQAAAAQVQELQKQTGQLRSLQSQVDTQTATLKDLQTQLAAETQAKSQAIQQRDAEVSAKKILQAQIDNQTAGTKDLQALLEAETKAKGQAIQQRDNEASAKKGLQSQLDVKTQNLSELQTQLTSATQAQSDTRQQLSQATEKLEKANAQAKDAQAESELLLHQLHQVQEELENYYLRHQAARQEADQHAQRWARLLRVQPSLQDFDAISLTNETPQAIHWRLQHIMVNGRAHGPFDFQTITENGITGFVLPKQADGTSPLRRWPASALRENAVTILPTKSGDNATQRAAQIVQLSATDWNLLNRVQSALTQAIETDTVTLKQTPKATLLNGLKAYQQIMGKNQGLIRFDNAELLGQQHQPTKDVLALRLSPIDFNGQHIEQIEFQLQANKTPEGRLQSVHLIFGETSQGTLLDNWQANTTNTASQSVMALQLSPQGWETETWPQLSPNDQNRIKALTDSLAIIWITLQTQGVRIEPGWTHMIDMASQLRTWSQPAAPAPQPETLSAPQPPTTTAHTNTTDTTESPIPPFTTPTSNAPAQSSTASYKTQSGRKTRKNRKSHP